MNRSGNITKTIASYIERIQKTIEEANWSGVEALAEEFMRCWQDKNQIFICGNGGSAGNAIHLANDFLYGIAKKTGGGISINALSSNQAVLTCLANDVGYDYIYSEQLAVMAKPGDLLIVLSGSGNSENIIQALVTAKKMNVKTAAILGFSGGKAKSLADILIHFEIDDMQISEDMQLIVGHMIMQYLYKNLVT